MSIAQENALSRRAPFCCSQKPVSGAAALVGLHSLTVAFPCLCSPPSHPTFCLFLCFSLCVSQFKTSRERTFRAIGFQPVRIHSESKAFTRLDPHSRLLYQQRAAALGWDRQLWSGQLVTAGQHRSPCGWDRYSTNHKLSSMISNTIAGNLYLTYFSFS